MKNAQHSYSKVEGTRWTYENGPGPRLLNQCLFVYMYAGLPIADTRDGTVYLCSIRVDTGTHLGGLCVGLCPHGHASPAGSPPGDSHDQHSGVWGRQRPRHCTTPRRLHPGRTAKDR